MIRGKAELTGGFLKEGWDRIYDNLVNRVDPHAHAASYAAVQDSEWYAEPEFSGKYLDLCVQIYKRTGNLKALKNARVVVDSILEHQRGDGYLGPYRAGLETAGFGVWNQTFTLLGMLSYYRATKEAAVLASALRGAAYIMEQFLSGKADILEAINDGTEHLSILLPLCELYTETKNERVKDYIAFIIARIKSSDLNYFHFESILKLKSRKGIESFVILLGLMKYAEVFGDGSAVDGVEKYWQEVNDTQIRNTGNGTVGEFWAENGNACQLYAAQTKPNETCVAVGWCELSLALFFQKQDAKFLNAVDKTLYNHMLASLAEDGSDFAYYQPNYGRRVRFTGESMYKCCRYRGFTLFTYLNEMLVFEDDRQIIPLLYAPCAYESEDSNMTVETAYPYDPAVKLRIRSRKDKTLLLRIPEKCALEGICINGEDIAVSVEAGYAAVDIQADVEYRIELALSNRLVTETGICAGQSYAAFSYGCVLLAAYNIDLSTDRLGSALKLEPASPAGDHRLEFVSDGTRNGQKRKIPFCEYSAADRFSVWVPYKN